MSLYNGYFDWTTGKTLYAKPRPLSNTPWSNDVIIASENGALGEYKFPDVNGIYEYVVFLQMTGIPLSTDPRIGRFANADESSSDDPDWVKFIYSGDIVFDGSVLTITSRANQFAVLIQQVTHFKRIEATLKQGTDQGATWAPSLAVRHDGRFIKVGIRGTGKITVLANGYFTEIPVAFNPDDGLRVRIINIENNLRAQYLVNNIWISVHGVYYDPFEVTEIVVGKSDETADRSNWPGDQGAVGTSYIEGLTLE